MRCVPALVHNGFTPLHLCFALIHNRSILGFAGRVVCCVINGTVEAAADRFANAMNALKARLEVVKGRIGRGGHVEGCVATSVAGEGAGKQIRTCKDAVTE